VAPFQLAVLALHESHGPSGLVRQGAAGADAEVIPAWAVLRALAAAAGARWLPLAGLPEGCAGLAWQHEGRPPQGLLANLGAEPIGLQAPPPWGSQQLRLQAYEVRACA
jgi:hypothetical protein